MYAAFSTVHVSVTESRTTNSQVYFCVTQPSLYSVTWYRITSIHPNNYLNHFLWHHSVYPMSPAIFTLCGGWARDTMLWMILSRGRCGKEWRRGIEIEELIPFIPWHDFQVTGNSMWRESSENNNYEEWVFPLLSALQYEVQLSRLKN